MNFIDLAQQQQQIKNQIDHNVQQVFAHGRYIMGPEVGALEEKLAAYVGVEHAIGCSSGTDAILMALMAYGVGPGDVIFTTPFTFIATAEVISLLGATPVFVDIDPDTFNIDAAKLALAVEAVENGDISIYPLPGTFSASSMTARGVIAVDLFGLPADYDMINKIAKNYGLFVIGDAAQSFGAEYKGKKACSLAAVSCTSFFPAKPLGGYGDGGMCFTGDDHLADIMRSIRVHGKGDHKYENIRTGINGRLDTLQAAILLAKFEIFPEEIELRQKVATKYTELLNRSSNLKTQQIPAVSKSAWAQYSLLAEDSSHRTALQKQLQEHNIPTAVYYPKPLHLQPVFASLGYEAGMFTVSEDAASRIFSIPMHPYLDEQTQEEVVKALTNGY